MVLHHFDIVSSLQIVLFMNFELPTPHRKSEQGKDE